MKRKVIVLFITYVLVNGCYNTEEDLTSIREFNFSLLESQDSVVANGFSNYSFIAEVPGVKYGDSKELKFKSTWGKWIGGSNTSIIPIKYNKTTDSYIDTILLKAGRTAGPFNIEVTEGIKHLGTLDFEALPQYPSFVQILADSLKLKVTPGNSTKLKALFSNKKGFPSYNIKFRFSTEAPVSIFPRDVFIDSAETIATLQISTETIIDTIKVYGEFPDLLGPQQFFVDTLKIIITKE
tara:strand:+ start:1842 stop:2555 length:714 start_codon:yes stop_codon:yes gene_type:complete